MSKEKVISLKVTAEDLEKGVANPEAMAEELGLKDFSHEAAAQFFLEAIRRGQSAQSVIELFMASNNQFLLKIANVLKENDPNDSASK